MKRLIMLVLMTFGCAAMAAAQSQQELIEMYRNGMLSQSQIDNLQTQQRQSVVRTRQTTNTISANDNKGGVDAQMQQAGYYDVNGNFIPVQQSARAKVDTTDPRYKEYMQPSLFHPFGDQDPLIAADC